jgi:hypothetical protein
MYICLYVYVCVCIPLVRYNNTIFGRFSWSHCGSGGDKNTYAGDKCSNSNFVQGVLFQLQSPFALKIYPLKPPLRTGFSVKPWTTTMIHIQAHTCKYIHIQTDTYQYMQIHAHIYHTSRYRWIHINTHICIHIQMSVGANTDTCIYKQYRHIHTHMSRYIHYAHTYTYKQYIHIYTRTCRYRIWATYDFQGKFIYACILFVYMSQIHAYMKQKINLNTYELARSLMEWLQERGRGKAPMPQHSLPALLLSQ